MIARLHGKVLDKHAPVLLLDVRGVGYELEVSAHTFSQLPAIGESVVVYTHLLVREDAHSLFGFALEQERNLFRLLLKINGVGGKLALTILSGMSVEQFCQCIQDNDTAQLVRLPGVGKKTAQRLVIELRDRVGQLSAGRARQGTHADAQTLYLKNSAIDAMLALGYRPQDAQRLVDQVYQQGMSCEAVIRQALQATIGSGPTVVEI